MEKKIFFPSWFFSVQSGANNHNTKAIFHFFLGFFVNQKFHKLDSVVDINSSFIKENLLNLHTKKAFPCHFQILLIKKQKEM